MLRKGSTNTYSNQSNSSINHESSDLIFHWQARKLSLHATKHEYTATSTNFPCLFIYTSFSLDLNNWTWSVINSELLPLSDQCQNVCMHALFDKVHLFNLDIGTLHKAFHLFRRVLITTSLNSWTCPMP